MPRLEASDADVSSNIRLQQHVFPGITRISRYTGPWKPLSRVHTILTILLVAPVTTVTVERSNSALAYVKTELRSTMSEDRLNDLVTSMLFVHKDISLDYDAVIDLFVRKNPRRMPLIDPLNNKTD